MMASAFDTFTFVPPFDDELKAYCGIVGSAEDARLALLLGIAARSVDLFTCNPWVDSEGADVPIPDDVKAIVYQLVCDIRDDWSKNPNWTMAKTDNLTESYGGILRLKSFWHRASTALLYHQIKVGCMI